MLDDPQLERFSHLGRRTFRLKLSTLILLLVALFVLWSTLSTGRSKSDAVDKEFCSAVTTDSYYWPQPEIFAPECDSPTLTQNVISSARNARWAKESPDPTKDLAGANQWLRDLIKHQKVFQEYDQRRRRSYQLELALPYAKNSVFLDGALIGDLWPFFTLLALAAAGALGFKQICYEMHSAVLIQKIDSDEVRARESALAEFGPGAFNKTDIGGKATFLYKKRLVLVPQSVATIILLTAIGLLSLRLLIDYSPQFSERGAEIFSGYYLYLYLFAVLLVVLLVQSRRLWRASVEQVLGAPVRSAGFFEIGWPWLDPDESPKGPDAVITACIAMVVLGNLFFDWDTSYRGVELLWHPSAMDIDLPWATRGLQFGLFFVVGFVLLCVAILAMRYWGFRSRHMAALYTVRRYCAVVIFVVLLFPLSYTLLSHYGNLMYSTFLPPLGVENQNILGSADLPAIDACSCDRAFLVFLNMTVLLAAIFVAKGKESWHESPEKLIQTAGMSTRENTTSRGGSPGEVPMGSSQLGEGGRKSDCNCD